MISFRLCTCNNYSELLPLRQVTYTEVEAAADTEQINVETPMPGQSLSLSRFAI